MSCPSARTDKAGVLPASEGLLRALGLSNAVGASLRGGTPELVAASWAIAAGGSRLARLKPCWLKNGAAAAAAAACRPQYMPSQDQIR